MEKQSKENKTRRKTTKPQEWQSFSNAADVKVENIPQMFLMILQGYYIIFVRE